MVPNAQNNNNTSWVGYFKHSRLVLKPIASSIIRIPFIFAALLTLWALRIPELFARISKELVTAKDSNAIAERFFEQKPLQQLLSTAILASIGDSISDAFKNGKKQFYAWLNVNNANFATQKAAELTSFIGAFTSTAITASPIAFMFGASKAKIRDILQFCLAFTIIKRFPSLASDVGGEISDRAVEATIQMAEHALNKIAPQAPVTSATNYMLSAYNATRSNILAKVVDPITYTVRTAVRLGLPF